MGNLKDNYPIQLRVWSEKTLLGAFTESRARGGGDFCGLGEGGGKRDGKGHFSEKIKYYGFFISVGNSRDVGLGRVGTA